MTLTVGSHLGPFQILAPIGSGGMGEVFRARATKLGRDVALKILPEAFASERSQISADGGIEPVWARNGSELFYRNGDKMMAVDVQRGDAFRAGSPHLLFEGQYARVVWGEANYDVSPDAGPELAMLECKTGLRAEVCRVVGKLRLY